MKKFSNFFFALFVTSALFFSCDNVEPDNPDGGGCDSTSTDKPAFVESDEVFLCGNCSDVTKHGYTVGILDQESHSYDAAALLSYDKLIENGYYIVGIRAYIGDKCENGRVFVGADYLNPDYVQEFTYKEGGWQYVMFDQPYDFRGDVYVGFHAEGVGPLMAVEPIRKKLTTEFVSLDGGKWTTLYKALGGNAFWSVQAIMAGGDYSRKKQHDVALDLVDCPIYSLVNDELYVNCEVLNLGVRPVDKISLKCELGTQVQTVDFSEKLMNGQSAVVSFPALTSNGSGMVNIRVGATLPGGVDSEIQNNFKTVNHRVYVEDLKRNTVLVEQFTSQYCGNCPDGAQVMAESIRGMKDPSKANWVIHHSGYRPDEFTLIESEYISTQIRVPGTPSCTVNRDITGFGYAWHPGYATAATLDDMLSRPALATLSIDHSYDPATREVILSVSGRSVPDEAYVTAILTQSGIYATQAGGGSDLVSGEKDYAHNNVPRYFFSEPLGDKLKLDGGGNYSVQYKYTVPDKVGGFECVPGDMDLVVYVHGLLDGMDNMIVYNADRLKLVDDGGADPYALRVLNCYRTAGAARSAVRFLPARFSY